MAISPKVLSLQVQHVQRQIDAIRRECANLFPEAGFNNETTAGYCSAAENLMGFVRAGIDTLVGPRAVLTAQDHAEAAEAAGRA